MTKIIFPGTFDPPTKGHLDIIERCSKKFDEIIVLIAVNPEKQTMFDVKTRLNLLNEMISNFSNVSVDYYEGLVVKYAEHNNISLIIRGIRNTTDFTYETELEMANKIVSKNVETLYINARADLANVKSSLVKELFRYSVDISSLVTSNVYDAMKSRQLLY